MPDGELKPSRADEINAVGAKYHLSGRVDAARLHYVAALMLNPNHTLSLQNLAGALLHYENFEASEALSRRALSSPRPVAPPSLPDSDPDYAFVKMNLALALLGQRRFGEAKAVLLESLRSKPESAPIWHNYGLALYMSGELGHALNVFDHSLKLNPDATECQNDRALTLLALGRFQQGLEAYEMRWKVLNKSPVLDLNLPEWKGEDLNGRNLLIHHEQGFGDGIMLCRFISEVSKIYPEVSIRIAAPQELVRLYSQNFPWPVFEWSNPDLSPWAAFHSPMLSLPRWLGITEDMISAQPYIHSIPSPDLSLRPGVKHIGLCWASGNHGAALRRRRRVIPIELFLPLCARSDVQVISLQKGEEQKDILRVGAEGLLTDPMQTCTDFADTAQIVSSLDLVISVDSVVAHLAGAMGKSVLMLGPYTRCWRWWDDPAGTPWYNNFRIFSQNGDGSWNSTVEDVLRAVQ